MKISLFCSLFVAAALWAASVVELSLGQVLEQSNSESRLSQDDVQRPDYIKLVEEYFSQGVTPENNLFAHLAQHIQINADDPELKKQLYEKLDVKPPAESDVLKSFAQWIESQHPKTQRSSWEPDFDAASTSIWKPTEHPNVDQWLNEFETNLDAIVEASKHKRSHMPLVFAKDNRYLAANRLLLTNSSRDVCNVLIIRANRSCGRNNFELWLKDIEALKRIALAVSRGHASVQKIVGIAVFKKANTMTAAAIRSGNFTDQELETLREVLVAGELVGDYDDMLQFGERFLVLDSVRFLQETKQMSDFLKNEEVKDNAGDISIDWHAADKAAAEVFSMVDAVLAHSTTDARYQTARELEDETRKLQVILEATVVNALTSNLVKAGEWIGQHVACVTMPALQILFSIQADHECQKTLLITAIDLERYRLANQKYPTSLQQLIPTYRKSLPTDPHTSQELIYKVNEKAYALYGLGGNGIDNGGAEYGDCCLQPFLSPAKTE
jgi:hypothetical protein